AQIAGRHVARVRDVRLAEDFDTGPEVYESVWAETDRLLLEFLAADLLYVALRKDPTCPRGGRRVIGQEIWPGLVQRKADELWSDDRDRLDLLSELGRARPLVPLIAELDVLRRERVPVVERHACPEHEVIRQAVLALTPAGGQARGHRTTRHGFDQRIVNRVEEDGRRRNTRRLSWIEPAPRNIRLHLPPT